MTAPARRPRPALPLAASLAAHALLLGLLVRWAPRSPPPAPPPIPVALRILPAAPASPATAPSSPPSAPPARPRGEPRATAPVGRPAPSRPAADPLLPDAAPAPGSPAWLAERGLEPGGEPPVPLPRTFAPSTAPAVAAEPAAGGESDARASADRMLSDLQAAARAASAPHSYWSGIRERLEKGFAPGWEVLEQGPGGGKGLVSGKGLRDAARQYLAGAERYGRAGNPHAGRKDDPGAPAPLADEVRRLQSRLPQETQAQHESARPEATLFHQELEVLVRLTQSAEGKLEKVELLQGSGNKVYDRLALAQARALGGEAEARLGPPPAQGRETIWAFVTSFDRFPPLPVVGCTFDAYFRPQGCFYPMKTSARSRVELRSVR